MIVYGKIKKLELMAEQYTALENGGVMGQASVSVCVAELSSERNGLSSVKAPRSPKPEKKEWKQWSITVKN